MAERGSEEEKKESRWRSWSFVDEVMGFEGMKWVSTHGEGGYTIKERSSPSSSFPRVVGKRREPDESSR